MKKIGDKIYTNKYGWQNIVGIRKDAVDGSTIYQIKIKGILHEYHEYSLPIEP